MPGTTILAAEVTHVSKHGFWLLLADEELLVPFDQFPWFQTHPHFRWFLPQRANSLLGADTQPKLAALRHGLGAA